ncbi:MAG: methyltransferase domain-containing protein [Solidesulfovibrio sp.]|jgi:SAM-dependent methyltransferase|uniref:methyltransferase domain-containing protein n=1 Tax=Solidesulfovibrio sp. TaxID=2910990 RepID=UPI0031598599
MSNYLSAVSVHYYIENTNYLYIRGWFLGPEKCDKVVIQNKDGKVIAQGTTNISRIDVFNRYPKYKDRNSGWSFSGDAGTGFDCNIFIVFYRGNKELHRLPYTVKRDPLIDTHIQWLNRRHAVTVVKPGVVPPAFLMYLLSSYGIPIRYKSIDQKEWENWLAKADYMVNYPKYCKEFGSFLMPKALQHYLSLTGRSIPKDSVCLDVASSNSPFWDIVRRLYGAKTSRQDQTYPTGIKDDTIGCDAVSIPLESNSLDFMSLHCSWEHFENDADMLFLHEALRLLKKGGTLWIGPLYMDVQDVVITSPHVWTSKYRGKTLPPLFSKTAALMFNEQVCQRQEKFISPKSLYEDFVRPLSPYADFAIEYYENHAEIPGGFPFSLVVVKTNEFA